MAQVLTRSSFINNFIRELSRILRQPINYNVVAQTEEATQVDIELPSGLTYFFRVKQVGDVWEFYCVVGRGAQLVGVLVATPTGPELPDTLGKFLLRERKKIYMASLFTFFRAHYFSECYIYDHRYYGLQIRDSEKDNAIGILVYERR
jgi:hypothetical protein